MFNDLCLSKAVHFAALTPVHLVEWKRLAGEAVGVIDIEVPHCIHGCWSYRQAGT